MAMKGTKRWLDFLPEAVKILNKTPHSRHGFTPISVNRRNERAIYEKFYSQPREIGTPKFHVGQKVRISNVFKTIN